MSNRTVRVILSMDITLTGSDERNALPCGPDGYNPRLLNVLKSAIEDGRYRLTGNAVITAESIKHFNKVYGTTYADHPIQAMPVKKEDST